MHYADREMCTSSPTAILIVKAAKNENALSYFRRVGGLVIEIKSLIENKRSHFYYCMSAIKYILFTIVHGLRWALDFELKID